MWHMRGYGYDGTGAIMGLLLGLALIVGVIALVVWLVRKQSPAPRGDDALNVLRHRYASGKLTREQFQQLENDLSQNTEGHCDNALDVIRRRYASGELTREQFQQLENDLSD
jgi:uncharacterized membrane protein